PRERLNPPNSDKPPLPEPEPDPASASRPMPFPNPIWRDSEGRRLPPHPCPKCGQNRGPMPLRVENLRHLGWQPYTVQSFQSWCGYLQEIIPFPREDGSVLFVDVIGEAS